MRRTVKISLKSNGVAELKKKLRAMSYETRNKGGRSALRRAAMVAARAAQQNALRIDNTATPESITKNIAIRWNGRLNRVTGDLGFRIGVLGGARDYSAYGELTPRKGSKSNPGGDTFYWRFLEFGTELTAARPFLRPAVESNLQAMTDIFVLHYSKAIDRAIKKGKS